MLFVTSVSISEFAFLLPALALSSMASCFDLLSAFVSAVCQLFDHVKVSPLSSLFRFMFCSIFIT